MARPSLTTGEAARRLQVAENTLRVWERRYGSPVPERTVGGHRRYRLSDIERLSDLLAKGLSVSSALSQLGERREVYTMCPRCGERIDHVRVRIG